MSKIIWLASYPKSGNTWFRAFLSNLRHDSDTPVSINALDGASAASRELFHDAVGIQSSALTPPEIERLLPTVFESIAAHSEGALFLKMHDAYTRTRDDHSRVPEQATQGAIYFLRNPLDLAISFAHHLGTDIDTAIERMADETHALADDPGRVHRQLRQPLLSWSSHVLSWLEGPGFPVHVIRYEDMAQAPTETFAAAACFAGLPCDPGHLDKALRFSAFAELQRQEQAYGFVDRPARARSFFRQGQVGEWRTALSVGQVARIVSDHGTVMKRFGYLNEDGTPPY